LALVAVDAARQGGADYADIRIGVLREIYPPSVQIALGYGVRARVRDAWSFQHGTILTTDAVAAAARSATLGAHVAAETNARFRSMVAGSAHTTAIDVVDSISDSISAPVVRGVWESPVAIDPFSVTVDDYQRLTASLGLMLDRLGFVSGNGGVYWGVETRVFAATNGSLVTQTTTRGGLTLSVSATLPHNMLDTVDFTVPGFGWTSAGFEAALRSDIATRMAEIAEETIRWRALPFRRFSDVGRYPVVFDGNVMANVIGHTVSLALDSDRAVGNEIEASGRSFLTPIAEVVTASKPAFSPLLTMTSGRETPSATAVRWDDEGVTPETFSLVDKGHVVDYYTTRETAPVLADWYRRRGTPLRSRGCLVAPTPGSIPMASGGDVRVAPGEQGTTIGALTRDMSHGFLLLGGAEVIASPGLTGGYMRPNITVEIQRGLPVARLSNVWLAFSTKALFEKGLVALGDGSTMRTADVDTYKGMPWETFRHPLTAPAALCKEIDVMQTDVHG